MMKPNRTSRTGDAMRTTALILATLTTLLPMQAGAADTDHRVTDRSEFVSLVAGRQLTHLGVALTVGDNGRISGRAFGKAVTGSWNWQDGYFCRTMTWGDEVLPHNCQTVRLEGSRLRFTSDQGAGDYARLTLK